jgi:DNA repair exonuclease SbcCD ATPase subunit
MIRNLEKSIKNQNLSKENINEANTKEDLMKLPGFKEIYKIQRNKQSMNYIIKDTFKIKDKSCSEETKNKVEKAQSVLEELSKIKKSIKSRNGTIKKTIEDFKAARDEINNIIVKFEEYENKSSKELENNITKSDETLADHKQKLEILLDSFDAEKYLELVEETVRTNQQHDLILSESEKKLSDCIQKISKCYLTK